MSAFFDMGGYGAYVWPAYAVSAGAILGLAFFIWRRGQRLRKELDALDASRKSKEGA